MRRIISILLENEPGALSRVVGLFSQRGYNIETLVSLLGDADLGAAAAKELKHTLLMFDAFHDVKEKADAGNAHARSVLQSWADGEWFTRRSVLPDKITVTVFKVPGETNTDDLSPA